MWGTSSVIVILYFVCLITSAVASIEHIKSTFGSNVCIKGSLSTITTKVTETLAIKESKSSSIYTNTTDKESLENSLYKLNELAEFNEIRHFFKLIKEEGPPHNKLFTVSLTLGDEEYISQGTSLKIARQKVATVALLNSEYEPPLVKEKEENVDTTTPTVLLNNLCAKLGIGVEYFLVNKDHKINVNNVNEKPKKSYIQKLNDSLDSEIHIRKDETQTKGPFKVAVQVGDLAFYGTSHTVQSARHDAASKAIYYLIKEVQDGNSVCLQEGSEEECKHAKANLKSPISLVYEAAQLRKLDIEFEVIEESGPPHKRIFTTKCTLGYLSTTGDGKSKKESKKIAAANMLERISELPEVSQAVQVNSIVKDKKKKNKKNKILKTNFDVISMHVDNLISTIKDYGLPSENNQDTAEGKYPKSHKPKHSRKSLQDGMLELGNALQFEIQFMDFNDDKQSYTIMSLHLSPEYMCLGQGPSPKLARNKAAKGGLILLRDIDFQNHFKNKRLALLESEIKQKISILLNKEVYEDIEDSPAYQTKHF